MANRKAILKKVNVNAKRHIHGTNYPVIHGLQLGLILTLQDIKKCLEEGAEVYEVLPDKTTIRLTEENYYKNNRKVKNPIGVDESKATISTESSFINSKMDCEDPKEPEEDSEELSEEDCLDEESE